MVLVVQSSVDGERLRETLLEPLVARSGMGEAVAPEGAPGVGVHHERRYLAVAEEAGSV